MLYVDSTNVPALKLYVGLGFTVNHIDRAYTGDVAAPAGAPDHTVAGLGAGEPGAGAGG
jgi:ribosomal protein S18 acetylase RimI-like enzyme